VIPEQPAPDTLHTTMLLPGPLAENWIVPCGLTWGLAGERVSFATATTVTVAEPDWLGSATEVATTLTVGDEGTEEGAV
jgi:hypothetical protein